MWNHRSSSAPRCDPWSRSAKNCSTAHTEQKTDIWWPDRTNTQLYYSRVTHVFLWHRIDSTLLHLLSHCQYCMLRNPSFGPILSSCSIPFFFPLLFDNVSELHRPPRRSVIWLQGSDWSLTGGCCRAFEAGFTHCYTHCSEMGRDVFKRIAVSSAAVRLLSPWLWYLKRWSVDLTSHWICFDWVRQGWEELVESFRFCQHLHLTSTPLTFNHSPA